MTPRRRPLEVKYVKALLDRAETAFQTVSLFKRNTGAIRIRDEKRGKDRMFRANKAGQCDIYAIHDGGGHSEIEVKRGTDLSPKQREWRDWCRERGIPWMLLDTIPGELPTRTIDRWVQELRKFFGLGGDHER